MPLTPDPYELETPPAIPGVTSTEAEDVFETSTLQEGVSPLDTNRCWPAFQGYSQPTPSHLREIIDDVMGRLRASSHVPVVNSPAYETLTPQSERPAPRLLVRGGGRYRPSLDAASLSGRARRKKPACRRHVHPL